MTVVRTVLFGISVVCITEELEGSQSAKVWSLWQHWFVVENLRNCPFWRMAVLLPHVAQHEEGDRQGPGFY